MVWNPFKNNVGEKAEVVLDYAPAMYSTEDFNKKIEEKFKGEVEQKEVKFPAELGEEHPFDFKLLEGLYKKFGFFTAVVDKYVDFVIGPGFYVESSEPRATKIIEDFMQDVNFDTKLRAWTKEALIKGNGFMELGGNVDDGIDGIKVLNANYMYVNRDKFGKIEGYNQYAGEFNKFDRKQIIPFETAQIAHIPFNIVGDCAYGLGIGYPAMGLINNLIQNSSDLHMLMNRKANSPVHAKLGKVDGNVKIIPKPEDVTKFGQKLEIMKNKTEWATDALVDISVVDFGNIGDKFSAVLEYDMDMLIYSFQVPGVLLGMARIPEGLAQVQMDAFERRIQSIQAELEKVIEEDIFKPILNSSGFDVHVEFQWGRPSNQEKENRLARLNELMKLPLISPSLVKLMEKDVVGLLDYNEDDFEEMSKAEEREREEMRSQALVPGQNQKAPQVQKKKEPQPKPKATERIIIKKSLVPKTIGIIEKDLGLEPIKKTNKIKFNKNLNYEHGKECSHCTESVENITDIEEWLGFNYREYLGQILGVLSAYDFNQIKAVNEIEVAAGYLSDKQVEEIRGIMNDGFEKGKSIKQMAKEVDKKAGLKDLYRMGEDGKIKTGASGLPILSKSADKRSIAIVRTEITRVANLGAVEYYKEKGFTQVRWDASYGNRVCPICEGLDGQIYEINGHPIIPAHTMCRCILSPVVGIK